MNRIALFYAVRPKAVLKFLGYPISIFGLAALVPFFGGLFLQEPQYAFNYLIVSVVSMLMGYSLTRINWHKNIQFNEAVVIVCLIYFYVAGISTVPLILTGFSPMDALFETISGVTTTGLSMISDWETVPMTTYFARAWLQWTGGLGIMLFSLAFLFGQGEITKKLHSVEGDSDDIFGGSKNLARGIALIYSSVTIGGVVLFLLLGTDFLQSLILTFTSVSTGGFASVADSIASLSKLQQGLVSLLTLVCAMSLPFYYQLWREGGAITVQGWQFIGLIALALSLGLVLGGSYEDFVTSISAQTTAGFSVYDLSELSPAKKLCMIFSMLIGGAVGSTAGGFKILRFFLFFICLKQIIIEQTLTQHAYHEPRLLGLPVSRKQIDEAMTLICLYVFVTSLSWLSFLSLGYPAIDSFFDVASAVGTVGLSTGVTSSELPLLLKGVLCVDMLLGRLEIFPWFFLLYPKTWLANRRNEL